MIMKKAQVTLFVIIAIMLIAAVVVVLSIKPSILRPTPAGIKEQVAAVKSHVGSCVESTSKEALAILSMQGGYIAPKYYIGDGVLHVTYWYDSGKDASPSLAEIEDELSRYINLFLPYCTDFAQFGLEITPGEVKTRTNIKPDFITIKVDYPILIAKGDITYELKEFSTKLPVRLGVAYEAARDIVDEQMKDPQRTCVSCLVGRGIEDDFFIELEAHEDSYIFTIIDENSAVYKPYEFSFANRME